MTLSTITTVNDDVLAELKSEMALRRTTEVILLFCFGGQTDAKIKIELDKLRIYCLLGDPGSLTAEEVRALSPKGIILSGGPISVYEDQIDFDLEILDLGIPVLGICLGAQVIANYMGATVQAGENAEFGVHQMRHVGEKSPLFFGIRGNLGVLQSHKDQITPTPDMEVLGTTGDVLAAFRINHLWGVQFHPEVHDTECGSEILENFCSWICDARDRFPVASEGEKLVWQIYDEAKGARVLLALSGGNDSNVTAALLHRAIGDISAIYIKGCDRADDEAFVLANYKEMDWIDLHVVDVTEELHVALAGLTKMHDKRVAMRQVYRDAIEAKAAEIGATHIAQGTLYTDISESGGSFEPDKIIFHPEDTVLEPHVREEREGPRKDQIKLHHNTDLHFSLPEILPLVNHVKDTARAIGRWLEVPEELLMRHPFPGPGLLVRITGEVTRERLHTAREIDRIYIEELRAADLYDYVWQAGAVAADLMVTTTKGDTRGEGFTLIVWAVHSVDGFTATWVYFEEEFLRRLSKRFTNELPGVGMVVMRISDKPPSTIEVG